MLSELVSIFSLFGNIFGLQSKEIKEISNIEIRIKNESILVSNQSPNSINNVIFVDKKDNIYARLSIMENESYDPFLIRTDYLIPMLVLRKNNIHKNTSISIGKAKNITHIYMIFSYGRNRYIKDSVSGKTKKLIAFRVWEYSWNRKSKHGFKYEEIIKKSRPMRVL